MEYRRVGESGLRVSQLSIGGWLTFGGDVDEKATGDILRCALDGGMNFIDLADAYARGGAEIATGKAIADIPRHQLVISSKLFWPMSDDPNDRGLSRKHIMESVERSLRNLGTDYLDIYFCHREDPETPLDETVRAMDDLVRQGKILYWGTSVWEARSLRKAHAVARRTNAVPPIVEQPQYNLLERSIERRVLPAARRLGMGVVVWSPLAGGLLTGKYNDGVPSGSRGDTTRWLEKNLTEENLQRVRAFTALAQETGCEPAALALAWLAAQPGISSVITGATSVKQVESNLRACDVNVTPELDRAVSQIFS